MSRWLPKRLFHSDSLHNFRNFVTFLAVQAVYETTLYLYRETFSSCTKVQDLRFGFSGTIGDTFATALLVSTVNVPLLGPSFLARTGLASFETGSSSMPDISLPETSGSALKVG